MVDPKFVRQESATGRKKGRHISAGGTRGQFSNGGVAIGIDDLDRYPGIDSIAEFNVLRSSYLPEQGRSSTGEITVITRGGTSQFHRSAYDFLTCSTPITSSTIVTESLWRAVPRLTAT